MPDLGKTSLAMLCANKGYHFISDERTLIKGKKIVGGISYIKLRKEWQKNKKLINSQVHFRIKNKSKIKAFIYPTITNGSFIATKWDANKAFWHLAEDFSRLIRGGSKFINHFTELAPSLDTEKLSKNRLKFVKKLSSEIPIYHLKGTHEDIIKFLENLK